MKPAALLPQHDSNLLKGHDYIGAAKANAPQRKKEYDRRVRDKNLNANKPKTSNVKKIETPKVAVSLSEPNPYFTSTKHKRFNGSETVSTPKKNEKVVPINKQPKQVGTHTLSNPPKETRRTSTPHKYVAPAQSQVKQKFVRLAA